MPKSPRLKIRVLPVVLVFLVFPGLTGFIHATPHDSTTHHPVAPPDTPSVSKSSLYLDDVKLKQKNDSLVLRIEGHLPTPCHYLDLPGHDRHADTLTITLMTWYDTEVICIQVLEPFVYYHELTPDRVKSTDYVRVEEHLFSLNREKSTE